ncbi:hypothetical protein J2S43_005273 [Catenuloplanes nepalensis]|uniref:Uncharacterized protein n=1 Tax=Catenuloplanes nepalensis TaxID=587533 RepID=A0ABT9N0H1_9ACTN|nr:hypothetical protein [Catenuloplanes nepalensis]MDP9796761.1 hypothetical protein [Catenuloplanes nepalensis]
MVDGEWAEQRERAIRAHASAAEARRDAEVAEARELMRGFVREAGERGIAAEELTAVPFGGGPGRLRTGLRGWYLRADRSVAVGTDAEFYSLTAPGGLWARLTGVTLAPSRPRLIVGEGGRDGESMPLAELLKRRLGDESVGSDG